MTETESLNAQVAVALRVELVKRGSTQAWLASQIGLTASGLSRRMSGEIPFTTDQIQKAANALEVTRDRLMAVAQ